MASYGLCRPKIFIAAIESDRWVVSFIGASKKFAHIELSAAKGGGFENHSSARNDETGFRLIPVEMVKVLTQRVYELLPHGDRGDEINGRCWTVP
jgi:hypothetical protein